ncbi:hypothetical protein H5410_036987 [Solanum commersonii]|uniref:Uncharacterized protein n=1 Tax=Solanum commersonii TaxID=4109 RepID=A0A9J5Y517_SOLCO|nr:hypothetical protein H5410_036987 [Solanum commersonii]
MPYQDYQYQNPLYDEIHEEFNNDEIWEHGGRDGNGVQRGGVRPQNLGWDQGMRDQEYGKKGDWMPLKLKHYETLEVAFHDASKVEADLKEEKSYKAKSSLTSTWSKGRGHVASECPNRRTIVALRNGYKTEDEDEDEVKNEGEGDRGEGEEGGSADEQERLDERVNFSCFMEKGKSLIDDDEELNMNVNLS